MKKFALLLGAATFVWAAQGHAYECNVPHDLYEHTTNINLVASTSACAGKGMMVWYEWAGTNCMQMNSNGYMQAKCGQQYYCQPFVSTFTGGSYGTKAELEEWDFGYFFRGWRNEATNLGGASETTSYDYIANYDIWYGGGVDVGTNQWEYKHMSYWYGSYYDSWAGPYAVATGHDYAFEGSGTMNAADMLALWKSQKHNEVLSRSGYTYYSYKMGTAGRNSHSRAAPVVVHDSGMGNYRPILIYQSENSGDCTNARSRLAAPSQSGVQDLVFAWTHTAYNGLDYVLGPEASRWGKGGPWPWVRK
jgi:hypothetical protein